MIWFEDNKILVRRCDDPQAWTIVYSKNDIINALLYYYGLNDDRYYDERFFVSKHYEIKYFRKL